MVTVRRAFGLPRTRPVGARPRRLLLLATLLLGLLYTHGVSTEGAGGHAVTAMLSGVAATGHTVEAERLPAAGATASGTGVHRQRPAPHGAAGHGVEDCLSGQPQQIAPLPIPCATRSVVVPVPPLLPTVASAADAASAHPPSVDSAILII
ncbi:hypothetical protein ACFWAT_05895 [Streptomyces syringium]|uniref:hypothetical protein n=1 Tax=Streptomyces syringium TaxID=76729 RepID=UPI0036500F09